MANMQIVPAGRNVNVEPQYVEMMVPLYSYGCERKINNALSHIKGKIIFILACVLGHNFHEVIRCLVLLVLVCIQLICRDIGWYMKICKRPKSMDRYVPTVDLSNQAQENGLRACLAQFKKLVKLT